MKKKILEIGKRFYWKYPALRPFIAPIHRRLFIKPKFSGWGMSTEAENPWDSEYYGDIFRKAAQDVKKFEFSKIPTGPNADKMDSVLWRHWIVSYAVRHVIEFTNCEKFNFVECGVGDGFSAFFALREISGNEKTANKSIMHLYDSWNQMRKEGLLESEKYYAGRYSELDIDRTKRNLEEFYNTVVYHQGYIPESFTSTPNPPDSIVYLSIDLNSSQSTIDTLEFFFPLLIRGGIILFDDYGQIGYVDTRKAIDRFFSNKPGILFEIPTSQAIYYR
jgi:hypothetical protein